MHFNFKQFHREARSQRERLEERQRGFLRLSPRQPRLREQVRNCVQGLSFITLGFGVAI